MSDSDDLVILYTPKRVSKSMEQCRKKLHSSSLRANQRALKAGNEETIPTLSKTAMKYCFLLSSSCPVERTFSYFKKIVTEDRQRLEV